MAYNRGQKKRLTVNQLRNLVKFLLITNGILLVAVIVMGFIIYLLRPQKDEKPITKADKKTYIVCVDAGHGGKDNGATGLDGSHEKDDNLEIALLVTKELKKRGVKVVMTRKDDTFVELEDRAVIANDAGADLFISLHRNSAASDTYGFEAWIHSSGSEKSYDIANDILVELESVGISDNRGVRAGTQGNTESNYSVIRNTSMTSLILEMGFMSSEKDLEFFSKNKKAYAEAIAEGIVKWLNANY